ncbi:MAG: trypsin-like peptidase domain-containing protein [Thermoguttaceae bacterium]|nr:trypsin-like peptidase domain-containing protein [Thermoguttaceae bacterium]
MPRFLNRLVAVTFLTIVSICVSVQARLTSEEIQRLRSEFVSSTYDDFVESVVFVTGDYEDPSEKSLSEYFVDNEEAKYGIATGFFITSDGYVLTNAHVVHRTINHYVRTLDDEEYEAELITILIQNDLALLKINPKKPVKPVKFKEDFEVRRGEIIMTIGHPHDMRYSCMQGIVSGTGRQLHLTDIDVYLSDVLQTDMALYGGASGGPWFDLDQKVVGITTSQQCDSQCISYGISHITILNKLLKLYDYPHRNGFVRGFRLKLEDGRCVAYRVDSDSPAGHAGLKDGDVVESVNGAPISGMTSWIEQESKFNAQTSVKIAVERGKKKEQKTFQFTFAPWKAPDVNETLWKKIGLKVRPMTNEEVKLFELKSPYAYVITDIDTSRFEGYEHKPQVNDALGKIAFVCPRNFDHFARLLDSLNEDDEIPMVFLRVVDQKTKQSVLLSGEQTAAQQGDVHESESANSKDSPSKNNSERKIIKTRIDIEGFEVK